LAGSFAQDFVESVRDAGDLVRLVSDYVPLKAAGSRLKGLCPFHEEKTPSFSVDPGRQLFYCFGCQTGGDVFKFVMLYEKMPFPEAVEFLARRWGVPIPAKSRAKADGPAERLLQMMDTAQAFFRATLADPAAGKTARHYLEQRGIDEATATKLGIGHAPDAWEALRGHLLSRRFKAEEILLGGLALQRKTGHGQYDRFRGRLIFPIRAPLRPGPGQRGHPQGGLRDRRRGVHGSRRAAAGGVRQLRRLARHGVQRPAGAVARPLL
jgi:DNA primase